MRGSCGISSEGGPGMSNCAFIAPRIDTVRNPDGARTCKPLTGQVRHSAFAQSPLHTYNWSSVPRTTIRAALPAPNADGADTASAEPSIISARKVCEIKVEARNCRLIKVKDCAPPLATQARFAPASKICGTALTCSHLNVKVEPMRRAI